jgi:hypothetical protein
MTIRYQILPTGPQDVSFDRHQFEKSAVQLAKKTRAQLAKKGFEPHDGVQVMVRKDRQRRPPVWLQDRQLFQQVVDAMPPRKRKPWLEVAVWYWGDGLTVGEIAGALEIKPHAVEQLIYRLRRLGTPQPPRKPSKAKLEMDAFLKRHLGTFFLSLPKFVSLPH